MLNALDRFLDTFADWIAPGRARWRQVIVGRRGRGPRADMVYRGLEVDGVRYLFTVEATENAKQRASKHWPA